MSRLHKQMAWVADGYNYTSRSGSHRSIPSVVGFDEASIIIENASNVTSSDVSRNVVISRGSAQRRRVRSAIERRAREPPAPAPTPTRLSPGRRPFSASAAMPSRRRPFSGRSEMSTMTTTGAPRKASDYHKSFTLVNRWLQEWKFQAQVGATPTAIYPDRHARCHGHDHVHNTLLRSRPQPACQDCRTEGPARRTWAWPASVQQEYLTEHARYQSAHRPRTAPVTRRERQVLTKHNHVIRGDAPHFCNFVFRSHFHDKQYPPVPPNPPTQSPYLLDDTPIVEVTHADDDDMRHEPISRPMSPSLFAQVADYFGDGADDQQSEASVRGPTPSPCPEPENVNRIPDVPPPPSVTEVASTPQLAWQGDDDSALSVPIPQQPPPSPEPSQASQPPPPLLKPSIKIPTARTESKTNSTAGSDVSKKSVPSTRPCAKRAKPDPKRPAKKPPAGQTAALRPNMDAKTRPKSVNIQQPTPRDTHSSDQKKETQPQAKPVSSGVSNPPRSPNKPAELPTTGLGARLTAEKPSSSSGRKDHQSPPKSPVPFYHPQLKERNDGGSMANSSEPPEPDTQVSRTQADSDVENMAATNTADDTKTKAKTKPHPWTFGRLALSQQSSRFELPMDMKSLETMSPQDYLRQHCIISSRRMELYHRTFIAHRDRGGVMLYKDLEKAIQGVLINTITPEEVATILALVQIDQETKVDFKLFCGLAAMAERILYPKFLTSDTADLRDHKKEKIECADFCALQWKFQGVDVNPPVRRILETL